MAIPRRTSADLKHVERVLNLALERAEVTVRYCAQSRYGYIGIDRYICVDAVDTVADGRHRWQMANTLVTALTIVEATLILESMLDVTRRLLEPTPVSR